jgi:uncharacterized membrane protein
MKGHETKERFWELDLIRGSLIILMVLYHLMYDLDKFGDYDFQLGSWYMKTMRIIGEVAFIFIVGVSLSLSRFRKRGELGFKGYFLRGFAIFTLGMLITGISLIIIPDQPIIFGILHCIGVGIILAYPFLRLRFTNLVLGAAIVVIGVVLYNFKFGFFWLLWLGLAPRGWDMADYFPLLPWFGVVLLGLFVGGLVYSDYKRLFKLPDLSEVVPIRFVDFVGRHTLVVYILHQPVLIGILFALGLVSFNL